jgi:hypothetical protein
MIYLKRTLFAEAGKKPATDRDNAGEKHGDGNTV